MCCNTRPGPRSVLTVFEEHTGRHVTQQEWHSLRDPKWGAREISGASIAEVRSTVSKVANTLDIDATYQTWLLSELMRSRISKPATQQVDELMQQRDTIGHVRRLRKDSQTVGLGKAMGCVRSDLQFFPGRSFLAGIASMPAGIADLIYQVSPTLSQLKISGLWVSPSTFAIQDANDVTIFDMGECTGSPCGVLRMRFDNAELLGPASNLVPTTGGDISSRLRSLLP
jgi:hypothetical protein